MPEPYTRVELKIPDSTGLAHQIDQACQARKIPVSRSEWLREAAREKLSRDGEQAGVQSMDLLNILSEME